jgi:hypothetical protein
MFRSFGGRIDDRIDGQMHASMIAGCGPQQSRKKTGVHTVLVVVNRISQISLHSCSSVGWSRSYEDAFSAFFDSNY